MVRFIFFATKPELFAQEISHIRSLLRTYNSKTVTITDQTQLIQLIPQLRKECSVVILFASSDEELESLYDVKESLGALPTILVLPDDNTMTLQRGMLLSPLYYMAKHSELNQYSVAVNEIYNIYESNFHKTSLFASYN